jgi:hypothetical protein
MTASCGGWLPSGADRGNSTDARDHFVCRCGAIIDDPADPKMLELHGPHFVAASLDRVEEGLKRWRATYGIK